jgi:hypothetical protein
VEILLDLPLEMAFCTDVDLLLDFCVRTPPGAYARRGLRRSFEHDSFASVDLSTWSHAEEASQKYALTSEENASVHAT